MPVKLVSPRRFWVSVPEQLGPWRAVARVHWLVWRMNFCWRKFCILHTRPIVRTQNLDSQGPGCVFPLFVSQTHRMLEAEDRLSVWWNVHLCESPGKDLWHLEWDSCGLAEGHVCSASPSNVMENKGGWLDEEWGQNQSEHRNSNTNNWL